MVTQSGLCQYKGVIVMLYMYVSMCINAGFLGVGVVEPRVFTDTAFYVIYSVLLFYTVYAWLADARIGHYKATVYSMVLNIEVTQ